MKSESRKIQTEKPFAGGIVIGDIVHVDAHPKRWAAKPGGTAKLEEIAPDMSFVVVRYVVQNGKEKIYAEHAQRIKVKVNSDVENSPGTTGNGAAASSRRRRSRGGSKSKAPSGDDVKLCWAKFGAHPYWPACYVNEYGDDAAQPRRGSAQLSVTFFGDESFNLVNRRNIKTVEEGFAANYHLVAEKLLGSGVSLGGYWTKAKIEAFNDAVEELFCHRAKQESRSVKSVKEEFLSAKSKRSKRKATGDSNPKQRKRRSSGGSCTSSASYSAPDTDAAAGPVSVLCMGCKANTVGDPHPEKILICDGCDGEIHMRCCDPPLKRKPRGDFFCRKCKQKKSSRRGKKGKARAKSSGAERPTKSKSKYTSSKTPPLNAKRKASRAKSAYDIVDLSSSSSDEDSEDDEAASAELDIPKGSLVDKECPRSPRKAGGEVVSSPLLREYHDHIFFSDGSGNDGCLGEEANAVYALRSVCYANCEGERLSSAFMDACVAALIDQDASAATLLRTSELVVANVRLVLLPHLELFPCSWRPVRWSTIENAMRAAVLDFNAAAFGCGNVAPWSASVLALEVTAKAMMDECFAYALSLLKRTREPRSELVASERSCAICLSAMVSIRRAQRECPGKFHLVWVKRMMGSFAALLRLFAGALSGGDNLAGDARISDLDVLRDQINGVRRRRKRKSFNCMNPSGAVRMLLAASHLAGSSFGCGVDLIPPKAGDLAVFDAHVNRVQVREKVDDPDRFGDVASTTKSASPVGNEEEASNLNYVDDDDDDALLSFDYMSPSKEPETRAPAPRTPVSVSKAPSVKKTPIIPVAVASTEKGLGAAKTPAVAISGSIVSKEKSPTPVIKWTPSSGDVKAKRKYKKRTKVQTKIRKSPWDATLIDQPVAASSRTLAAPKSKPGAPQIRIANTCSCGITLKLQAGSSAGDAKPASIQVPPFGERLVLGRRAASCNCVLSCSDKDKMLGISRVHAHLWRSREGNLFVRDNGAQNGVFLNFQRIVPRTNINVDVSEKLIIGGGKHVAVGEAKIFDATFVYKQHITHDPSCPYHTKNAPPAVR